LTCFTSTNVQILTQKAQALEYRGAGTVTNFDPALYASDDAAAAPPRPRSLDDEHALDAYTEHELANDDALEAHQSTRNPPAPQHSRAKLGAKAFELSSISSAAAVAAAADRKRCRLLSTSPCPSELSGPDFFFCAGGYHMRHAGLVEAHIQPKKNTKKLGPSLIAEKCKQTCLLHALSA